MLPAMFAPLLLLACTHPATEVAEREAPWYRLDEAAQAALGIQLVPLPAGEPVGAWPRVVIRRDGIDLDDRSLWLTLDVDTRAALSAGQLRALLIEQTGLVGLEEGRLAVLDDSPAALPDLEVALRTLRFSLEAATSRDGAPAPALYGPVVVPDARVPWQTVELVMVSALNAGWTRSAVAGTVGDRLRAPGAGGTGAWAWDACPVQAIATVGSEGVELTVARSPPLAAAVGSCEFSAPEALGPGLSALADRCLPIWDHAWSTTPPGRRGEAPPELLGRPCVGLRVGGQGEAPSASVLEAMASVSEAWPTVRPGPIAPSKALDAERCDYAVVVDELDPKQLERICGEPALRIWMEDTLAAAASSGGASEDSWQRSTIAASVGSETTARAFPAWAAHLRGPPGGSPGGSTDVFAEESIGMSLDEALRSASGGTKEAP